MTTMRRMKWQPPPPPTPRILNLPRRSRRRQQPKSASHGGAIILPHSLNNSKTNTNTQEEEFAAPVVVLNSGSDRRRDNGLLETETETEEAAAAGDEEHNKWRFQAEIMRAECKFLRMEREIAVRSLDRERAFVETTLKSALHTLISVKRRIQEGQSVNQVLEDEIEDLANRLAELQKCTRRPRARNILNSSENTKYRNRNFNRMQSTVLQKQLHSLLLLSAGATSKQRLKLDAADGTLVDDFPFCSNTTISNNKLTDVEAVTRKINGLSKGKLLQMEEECGLMISVNVPNCSTNTSASTSSKGYDLCDIPATTTSSSSLVPPDSSQEMTPTEQKVLLCSGNCKAIVTKIMEQVRAETEQWSQMQQMLGQVREEIEQLQASRAFWEDRALDAQHNIHSLHSTVNEWKEKALSLEIKENQHQKQVNLLQQELEKLKMKKLDPPAARTKQLEPMPLKALLKIEKENRVLTRRLKGTNGINENCSPPKDGRRHLQKDGSKISSYSSPNRFPFKDIGNLSPLPLVRQKSTRRSVYPLSSPQKSSVWK